MSIKITEGMQFVSKDNLHRFETKMYDFYGDGKEMCAFDGQSIYPMTEMDLSEYNPIIDGKVINENVEYVM